MVRSFHGRHQSGALLIVASLACLMMAFSRLMQ